MNQFGNSNRDFEEKERSGFVTHHKRQRRKSVVGSCLNEVSLKNKVKTFLFFSKRRMRKKNHEVRHILQHRFLNINSSKLIPLHTFLCNHSSTHILLYVVVVALVYRCFVKIILKT